MAEQENLKENIIRVAKDKDHSPRQVDALRSGIKRSQCTLPLQVKTISNKD